MSTSDVVDPTGRDAPLRVTVTTIEIPAETARCLSDADELRRAVTPFVAGGALTLAPAARHRPVRAALRRWSPLRPFIAMHANYRLAREALGARGAMSVVYVCIAAGVASLLWRHYTIPIGIAGGLLVSGILFVRSGAYREYLAAIEETHGLPPLGAILRYNVTYLVERIAARWRR
jgi:hypothetical protein